MNDAETATALLFPGALGDFLCWLPALGALRQTSQSPFLVIARHAAGELLSMRDTRVISIESATIADLFHDRHPSSPATRRLFHAVERVLSWTGAAEPIFAQRLAQACGGVIATFAFRGMRPGEHAVDYYARCAGVQPASSVASWLRTDDIWAERFLTDSGLRRVRWLAVHAGSGAPRKNWGGFAELIVEWKHIGPVLELRGPAEADAPSIGADVIVIDEPLPRIGALLRHSAAYVGNDSGITHLAAALGANGVALFGSSDPLVWAPRAKAMAVVDAIAPCSTCPEHVFCEHRLPVSRVLEVLHRAPGLVLHHSTGRL